jgi:CheY-like chemotaxis protein
MLTAYSQNILDDVPMKEISETELVAGLVLDRSQQPNSDLASGGSGCPVSLAFPLPTTGIKVLVIDDEEAVLHVTCMMMKKLGMIPVGLSSGSQGIEHVMQSGETLDLLFLDIMLADTSGFVIYQRVRRQLPRLPVVLFSGYASRTALQAILDEDCNVRFLSKPFSVSDIRAVVSMPD